MTTAAPKPAGRSEPDLGEIEQRINATRHAFLDALEACRDDDGVGKEIADTYLKKFVDDHPRRADIAKDHAREATQLVADFASERATFTTNVALVNQMMSSALSWLQVVAIERLLGGGKQNAGTTTKETG